MLGGEEAAGAGAKDGDCQVFVMLPLLQPEIWGNLLSFHPLTAGRPSFASKVPSESRLAASTAPGKHASASISVASAASRLRGQGTIAVARDLLSKEYCTHGGVLKK
jgi:hypothetical protein